MQMLGVVVSVNADATHRFSKLPQSAIRLIAGLGVEGDAHSGVTVQHLSRVAQDPTLPNLRQVHLLQEELFNEVASCGHSVSPGQMGENVTTRGVDLLSLPVGTLVALGKDAVVEITGLRNPCAQIEAFQPGLLKAVCGKDENGALIRKSGIMGIVRASGKVQSGDRIVITLPPEPHKRLERV